MRNTPTINELWYISGWKVNTYIDRIVVVVSEGKRDGKSDLIRATVITWFNLATIDSCTGQPFQIALLGCKHEIN